MLFFMSRRLDIDGSVVCVLGSCSSYRSAEAGVCLPLHHREHSGGENRGESRDETQAR